VSVLGRLAILMAGAMYLIVAAGEGPSRYLIVFLMGICVFLCLGAALVLRLRAWQ
jgi:hypothetical protein